MPAPNGPSLAPHALLLAMIVIWGGSYAVVKASLESLSPFAVIAVRFWIALACLLPFLGRTALADLRACRRHGLLAGVALAIGYMLQTVGMNETSASTGGFLAGVLVLLVAVGGSLWFRAPFGPRAIVGLVLGLAGIVMLCWKADAEGGATADTPRGIVLQIGSMASYAMHVLLLSRHGNGKPAFAYCTWQLAVVAVAATIAVGVDGRFAVIPDTVPLWTPSLLLLLAYLGFLATALGIAVQTKVQHRIPAVHVALLFALQPLFAAVIAWATLGDRMGTLQVAGGAVIVLGVVLTSFDRRQA